MSRAIRGTDGETDTGAADDNGGVTSRELQPLPVPGGARALDVVPDLDRALRGAGPALLPLPADEPKQARRTAEVLRAGQPLEAGEDAPDDPTALVIATSGSTGTPKGVLLSGGALRASASATHEHLGGPGAWLLAMPAHHIAGIQVLVRSLLAGTKPEAVDTAGGFRPAAFAQAAERTLSSGGRHYTALVPTQLSRLIDDERGLEALRRFDAVLLGGAATPPSLLDRARRAGVRGVTTYGMSETSGGCVYDGIPLRDVRVRTGGQTGPIELSGPVLARGYRGGDGGSAFRDGWFRTGDLGRWRDGHLEVLGRADDVIISGGVNIAPAPVERILTEQVGVREACVLGLEDPEWGEIVAAAIVPEDTAATPSVDELRAAVRAEAGAASAPRRITFLDELPLRGPGKPDRRALREALRS